MRGGCKKFVAIESKSFDLNVIGNKEDIENLREWKGEEIFYFFA